TSGVLSLGLPEAPAEGSPSDAAPSGEVADVALPSMTNDALLNALTAPAAAAADTDDEEAPAPTTTSPLVRSERSVAPVEASRAASPRLSFWLAVVLAAAALV